MDPSVFAAALGPMRAVFRDAGHWVVYQGPTTGRVVGDFGRVISEGTTPPPVRVKASIDSTPRPDEVTVYGNVADWAAGNKAIVRVLAEDVVPDDGGTFTFEGEGRTYDIKAINPVRTVQGTIFRYDCYVGVE